MELKGSQKTYLRGLAHHLLPVVVVGQNGVTDELIQAVNQALSDHELIKVKFVDHKDEKKELSVLIAEGSGSYNLGLIGNMAIFYKQNKDITKRKIKFKKENSSKETGFLE